MQNDFTPQNKREQLIWTIHITHDAIMDVNYVYMDGEKVFESKAEDCPATIVEFAKAMENEEIDY